MRVSKRYAGSFHWSPSGNQLAWSGSDDVTSQIWVSDADGQNQTPISDDGHAEPSDAPNKSKYVTYALTERGLSLEPVLLELLRWGARYMSSGPGDDRVDPAWTVLALRALLQGPSPARDQPATLHVEVDEHEINISVNDHQRRVEAGLHGTSTARLVTSMPAILEVASGERPWIALAELVEGDTDALGAALSRHT